MYKLATIILLAISSICVIAQDASEVKFLQSSLDESINKLNTV